eukprot:scaffold20994_cov124-Isochrysis_galbana.AAC.2
MSGGKGVPRFCDRRPWRFHIRIVTRFLIGEMGPCAGDARGSAPRSFGRAEAKSGEGLVATFRNPLTTRQSGRRGSVLAGEGQGRTRASRQHGGGPPS